MKRQGNLIEKIADYENLHWAFWKAKRGKNTKKEVIEFGQNLESNLMVLNKEILSGNLILGNYNFFKIFEPKERQIVAATFKDRILHHAVMNVCHWSFENFQINDSYASRQGKGTYAAIERATKFHKKYNYFMKIDCAKYFDNIDHLILKTQLLKRFKDKILLKTFSTIIDSYQVNTAKGLPIGNLTSQYFANHYLAIADRFLKETAKVPAMIRYMDDILMYHNNNKQLYALGQAFKKFCFDELKITFKHQYQNKTEIGVSFLGVLINKNYICLNQNSKRRLVNKYKDALFAYEIGHISETTYNQKLGNLMARPLKVKSYHFRQQLLGIQT